MKRVLKKYICLLLCIFLFSSNALVAIAQEEIKEEVEISEGTEVEVEVEGQGQVESQEKFKEEPKEEPAQEELPEEEAELSQLTEPELEPEVESPEVQEKKEEIKALVEEGAVASDEFIVVTVDEAITEEAVEEVTQDEVKEVISNEDSSLVVVETTENIEDKMLEYEERPEVLYVQPNFFYTLEEEANDPNIATNQWHLNNNEVGIKKAWNNLDMNSSNVKIAILDTGALTTHEDLSGNIAGTYDVVKNSSAVTDLGGHGTHVAGIAAATGKNGKGGAGVAFHTKLLIYNVFEEVDGVQGCYSSKVAEAYNMAVNAGASVVNMSFGAYYEAGVTEASLNGSAYQYDKLVKDAIEAGAKKGVVTVCAGGNSGKIQNFHFPSDLDACISVTATNSGGSIVPGWGYNNYKDIAAPGYNIWSTSASGNSKYEVKSGTSMAAPVVSGIVALMKSVKPSLSVAEVKSILYSTATDKGAAGYDPYYGNGLVNADLAIQQSIIPITGLALDKTTVSLNGTNSATLKTTIAPSNATQSRAITWSSNNNNIAKVSSSGVVTGVKPGNAVITAKTVNGKTATCQVTVKGVGITGVKLDKTTLSVYRGASATLKGSILPTNTTDSKTLTWSTSNKGVATITSGGVVKGIKAGSATITVKTSNGKTATCKVTVSEIPITSVKLNQTGRSISKGDAFTLKATIGPTNTTLSKTITWTSSNTKVAKVNASGSVTGVNVGTATITAKTSNGKTATCKVTVTPKGWSKEKGTWYYYRDGQKVKGWIVDGGKWYSLDTSTGAMKIGWDWDRSYHGWFYFNSSGAMLSNTWLYQGGTWYYLNGSGFMLENKWGFINGSWYFFEWGGRMCQNQWIYDGAWYYLGSSGAMLTNTQTPDGYWVDANGVWR
ncbi:uncharacterized protein YjdB [Aequitasia blattaphilus]|uniref:S8 family serine peptidase n=1 Tax=Aequitasia blattaphilus TaxID=2949332 RepID=A0ABT1E695_9FIRM|nr:S8 family serine peptidase [Aequitasia blattaphilus]MCP1101231.1 S8 family serine peptidase [Aequitasia blattaphilus]MCR8613871.1 S8 family serine peptidase [Aequitasia blattaphilus]